MVHKISMWLVQELHCSFLYITTTYDQTAFFQFHSAFFCSTISEPIFAHTGTWKKNTNFKWNTCYILLQNHSVHGFPLEIFGYQSKPFENWDAFDMWRDAKNTFLHTRIMHYNRVLTFRITWMCSAQGMCLYLVPIAPCWAAFVLE